MFLLLYCRCRLLIRNIKSDWLNVISDWLYYKFFKNLYWKSYHLLVSDCSKVLTLMCPWCWPGWFVCCQSWCWGWPGPAQSISLNQGDSGKKQLEIRLQGITSHRLKTWNVWILLNCIPYSIIPLPWLELKLRPILYSPLRWSSKACLLLSSLLLTRLLKLISL